MKQMLFVSIITAIANTFVAGSQPAPATEKSSSDFFAPYNFLVGNWTAEGGGGQPGTGTGSFTFKPDLGEKILVRRNHADYPASKDRPASSHDDLLILYPDASGASGKAVYFDNEGHVINYSVDVSSDKNMITFVSEKLDGKPRFRLSYAKTGSDSVTIKFEMAPPGKPEGFTPYVTGNARKSP